MRHKNKNNKPKSMGYLHVLYLESEKVYGCGKCRTHLSEINEIISKEFQGAHGKAYLFNKVY